MVETCPTEMIKKHCGEMFHSVMLGQNICSKYNRKRIQELEQRLRMSPIYQNEDCTPSPGVRQTPDDFKARDELKLMYTESGRSHTNFDNQKDLILTVTESSL